MLQCEREKLYNWEGQFLSIGISESRERYGTYPVPWNYTSNAYNMKLPNVYIESEDLSDNEIMSKILEFRVHGCYIFCALDNYDFLKSFKYMRDLNIYKAYNLPDLSFLSFFEECRMLFLSKAHLKDINAVAGSDSRLASPRCVALYDCTVDDISYLKEKACIFNELIICNPESRCERERWKGLNGARYYEFTGENK